MTHLLKEVQRAEEQLLVGNIILYPTDTIWGLGCDAQNEQAVQKIFQIKERPDDKSFILLVSGMEMLEKYVADIPENFEKVQQDYQDRPTTYIFPDAQNLANGLQRPDKTVAIRIVKKDEFCHKLITNFGRPIVSTSANISGQESGGSFSNVPEPILQKVDYVVNWRQDEQINASPSRIIKLLADGSTQIIRE